MLPVFNIEDENLREEDAGGYTLSLRFGIDTFSYSILDISRSKFLGVSVFDLGKNKSIAEAVDKTKKIIDSSALLKKKFKKVNVSLITPKSTLVPDAIFDKEKSESYLNFNHTIEKTEKAMSNFLPQLDVWNVFSGELSVLKMFEQFHPNATIHHYSTALITSLLAQFKNNPEKIVVVQVQSGSFEIIVLEAGNLLYYNSFLHHSPEDFMYYLMFACDRQKLNPEKTQLVLVGEIEKNSAIYSLLHKYFRNIRFGERMDSFQYSYGFSEVAPHFFYNLFSQPLCE